MPIKHRKTTLFKGQLLLNLSLRSSSLKVRQGQRDTTGRGGLGRGRCWWYHHYWIAVLCNQATVRDMPGQAVKIAQKLHQNSKVYAGLIDGISRRDMASRHWISCLPSRVDISRFAVLRASARWYRRAYLNRKCLACSEHVLGAVKALVELSSDVRVNSVDTRHKARHDVAVLKARPAHGRLVLSPVRVHPRTVGGEPPFWVAHAQVVAIFVEPAVGACSWSVAMVYHSHRITSPLQTKYSPSPGFLHSNQRSMLAPESPNLCYFSWLNEAIRCCQHGQE